MTTLGRDKHAAGGRPGTLCTERGSGKGRTPGPTCASKPSGHWNSPGQRTRSPPKHRPGTSILTDQEKKSLYLEYARGVSYAMEGKSEAQSMWRRAFGKKGDWDPSPLGGAFLRMYLDGKTDPEVIAAAGKEIGGDEQFQTKVVKVLTDFLQAQVSLGRLRKEESDRIRLLGDQHLKAILKKPGIELRKELNVIIGGVEAIGVDSATFISDTPTDTGSIAKYRVDIRIGDEYHFKNIRHGEQDKFRRELAGYLHARRFGKFEDAYNAESSVGIGTSYIPALPHFSGARKTHLNDAAIFACFMYALEVNGWTRGLRWDVVIPVQIDLSFVHSHDSKQSHGAAGHR